MLKLLAPLVLGFALAAAPAGAVVVLTQSQSFDSGEAFALAGSDSHTADAAPVGSLFTATAISVENDPNADGTASASAAMLYNADLQRLSFAASTSSRLEDARARARAAIIINAENTGTDPFRLFLDIEIDSIAMQFDNLLSLFSNGQITITDEGSAVGGDGRLFMSRNLITSSQFSLGCDVSGLPDSASCSGGPQTLSFDLGLVLNPGQSTNRKLETQLNLENLRFNDSTSLFTGRLGGVRFSFRGVDLVAPPPGVPEPATWTMMIVGVGLVGGTARRRSQVRPGQVPEAGRLRAAA